jgi:DedD protein
MERQKIFWVVLSVSVFVVVVLVVGVFLLRQKPQASLASATPTVTPLADPGTQVYEYQASPSAASSQQGTGNQAGGNTETMHFYIGEGESKGGTGQNGSAAAPSGTAPSGGATAPKAGSTTAPGASGSAPAAVTAAPATPATTGTSRNVPGLPQSTVAKATPAPRPAPRVTEYWIQTGSYKSQTKAEDLASLLGDKGLSGRVFSYAAQGNTWYRVRVGPYTSKGEADKFLADVKKLQGLASSFISQVAPPKTPVN